MEIVVYADVLFALNFWMDLMLVFLTVLSGRQEVHLLPITLSGGVLALYGTLIVYPALHWCFSFLGRVLVSLAAMRLLCGRAGIKQWLMLTLRFWLISLVLGGAVFALTMLTELGQTLRAVMINGSLYLDIHFGTLLLGIGLTYGLMLGFCALTVRRFARARILIPFSMTVAGRELAVTALLDTGCELTAPVSGDAMMLVSPELLAGVAYREAFRLPIATAGGMDAIPAFYPERLICLDKRYQIAGIPAVGVAAAALARDGLYTAVLNPDMLTERKEIGGSCHEAEKTAHTWLFTKTGRAAGAYAEKAGALHRRKRNPAAAAQSRGGGGTASTAGSAGDAPKCAANAD